MEPPKNVGVSKNARSIPFFRTQQGLAELGVMGAWFKTFAVHIFSNPSTSLRAAQRTQPMRNSQGKGTSYGSSCVLINCKEMGHG